MGGIRQSECSIDFEVSGGTEMTINLESQQQGDISIKNVRISKKVRRREGVIGAYRS